MNRVYVVAESVCVWLRVHARREPLLVRACFAYAAVPRRVVAVGHPVGVQPSHRNGRRRRKLKPAIRQCHSIGAQATLPQWACDRQLVIKRHRSPNKLTLQLAWEAGDDNARLRAEMREHRWNPEGSRSDTKKWVQVVRLPADTKEGSIDATLDRCDRVVRSVKTPAGKDAGWRILDHDRVWVERKRESVKDTLAELGVPSDQRAIIASGLERRNWTHRNLPFQPQFPGNRVWNIGAQLAFLPSDGDREPVHPH